MSLSDLIAHDEMRRGSMTRVKYLARIGKIRTFEKLDAAEIIASRYNDVEASARILEQRSVLSLRQGTLQEIRGGVPARGGFLSHPYPQLSGNRQRTAVARGHPRQTMHEIDWEGFAESQRLQEQEREENEEIERLALALTDPTPQKEEEPAIRQIRFRKKGGV